MTTTNSKSVTLFTLKGPEMPSKMEENINLARHLPFYGKVNRLKPFNGDFSEQPTLKLMIDEELSKGSSEDAEGEEDIVEGGVKRLDLITDFLPPSISSPLPDLSLDLLPRSLPLPSQGHRRGAIHPHR